MNSTEAYKGFVSFLILAGAIGATFFSFKYIGSSTNLLSFASDKASAPKYIEVSNTTENSAILNWYTASDIIGVVIYSEGKDCFEDKKNNYQSCSLISESTATKNHKLELTNLSSGITYYYKIKGDSYLYPENDVLAFTTIKGAEEPQIVEALPANEPTIEKGDQGFAPASAPQEDDGFAPQADYFQQAPSTDDQDGFAQPNEQVLGISTKAKSNVIEEFREALIFNNLRYDFDKNGKVENQDYPLYLMFINNPED